MERGSENVQLAIIGYDKGIRVDNNTLHLIEDHTYAYSMNGHGLDDDVPVCSPALVPGTLYQGHPEINRYDQSRQPVWSRVKRRPDGA